MNCLCNLFDNEIVWLILIALLIAGYCNSGSGCGCGCGAAPAYSGYGNGCGCGSGCGCN